MEWEAVSIEHFAFGVINPINNEGPKEKATHIFNSNLILKFFWHPILFLYFNSNKDRYNNYNYK